MAIDPKDINEEGIHTGYTTPPNDQPVTDGRHYEKTTIPNVIVPVSDNVDGPAEGQELRDKVEQATARAVHPGQVTEGVVPDETGKDDNEDEDNVNDDETRQRIEDAEKRATEQENVGPDKPKANTRQVKPQNQR